MKLIMKVFLAAIILGGSSLAAAAPSVDVEASVRYQPPQEEIVVDVTVNGVLPKPARYGAHAYFDRFGSSDGNPAGGVFVTKDGRDNTGGPFEVTDTEGPDPIGDLIFGSFDRACHATGLC